MTTEIARREAQELALRPAEMTIEELVARKRKVQAAMKEVMQEGEHYGKIPGTTKPTLLKPGAECLLNLFMFAPEYPVREQWDGDHLSITSTCRLTHIPTQLFVGAGMGSCTTKESKYAYRASQRHCPNCGSDALMRSKFPPRGQAQAPPGWFCFGKRGGCNAEFAYDDQQITSQPEGRAPNPDLPDLYNTVLKMSNKRALVAAVLNATGASDIFTQDVDDKDEVPADPPAPPESTSNPVAPPSREPGEDEPPERVEPGDVRIKQAARRELTRRGVEIPKG